MAAVDIERYINAATEHGADSDPDMEVGDLQGMLRAAFEFLTTPQKREWSKKMEVAAVLEWEGGED